MQIDNEAYFNLLKTDRLSKTTINSVLDHMGKLGLRNSLVLPDLKKKNTTKNEEKITEYLTKLDLRLIEGNKSWEGLFVGFPGNVNELSTKSVGTPYLRKILYPILDLHHRLQTQTGKRLPCIYFVGERFSDVFLRKFDLLKEVVPHIIVLTHDLNACSKNKKLPLKTEILQENESWTQMKLSQMMKSEKGLVIPTKKKELSIRFLSYEVPCNEGTEILKDWIF
jgi:hypothetical protein